uniref:Secreted protein n=1 Tax=Yersinia enterocolitica W22703 TaxID=913028 RepID=F4N450_YEREN|nr:unknown protein [Yersinia enterocolitica W22703]
MKSILQRTIGLLLLMIASDGALAAVVCSPLNGAPRTDTVQLSPPVISAGAGYPCGDSDLSGAVDEW